MGTSVVLDVVIGLILMYLLLSLISTVINEYIASFLKLRARNLRAGIENLLDDPAIKEAMAKAPLVKAAAAVSGKQGPSYLPSRTFALALLDAVGKQNGVAKLENAKAVTGAIAQLPDSNLKGVLETLTQDAKDDVEEIRAQIAGWFDDMMDRASGVYKRKMQLISLAVGLALAVGANADTVAVAKALWSDATLRAQLVQSASDFVERTEYIDDLMDLEQIQTELRPMPIGWDFNAPYFGTDWYASLSGIFLKICGLLLTAAAVALGAPFWFDLLSKFVKLRGSGARPKASGAK